MQRLDIPGTLGVHNRLILQGLERGGSAGSRAVVEGSGGCATRRSAYVQKLLELGALPVRASESMGL